MFNISIVFKLCFFNGDHKQYTGVTYKKFDVNAFLAYIYDNVKSARI